MTRTSSNLPVCVHCGTPRPADEESCPNCGMPWIDSSIADAMAASGGVVVLEAKDGSASTAPLPPPTPPPTEPPLDETGEFDFSDWTLPPNPKRSRAWWLMLPMAVAAVVALWVNVFVESDDEPSPPLAVVTAVSASTVAPVTTVPPTDTETVATTSSTTTTTIFFPAANSWDAVGEPIPVSDLTLKASGIGPIDIGFPITEAAGALVSSLGVAQGAGIDSDTCPDSDWYWLEWGDLLGVFDGYTPSAEFIGYTYETDGTSEPDPMLETLSGLQLGDTVETLHRTYASYTVSFEIIEGGDYFRLSDGGDLLLWGPVTSTESQGTIEGIYSPDACPSEN